MSFLQLAELFAGYFACAAILALAVLTVWIHLHGGDSLRLLDGRRLGSVLDDRDRHRHIVDVALAEDREVAALDALWELPARRHP